MTAALQLAVSTWMATSFIAVIQITSNSENTNRPHRHHGCKPTRNRGAQSFDRICQVAPTWTFHLINSSLQGPPDSPPVVQPIFHNTQTLEYDVDESEVVTHQPVSEIPPVYCPNSTSPIRKFRSEAEMTESISVSQQKSEALFRYGNAATQASSCGRKRRVSNRH